MTIPGMLSMCASEGCILYQRAFVPAAVYSQPAYVTHITYRGNLVYVDGTSKYVNLFFASGSVHYALVYGKIGLVRYPNPMVLNN